MGGMTDPDTIKLYNTRAAEFAARHEKDDPTGSLQRFMALLPAGAHVLDLGCGPGIASAHMAAAGHHPDPMDASSGMVDYAISTHGVPARLASFDQIAGEDLYDAVWANFSLLHAQRSAFSGHLAALHRALKPGGLLHLGMKLGEGEKRDSLARLYTYYSEDDLVTYLEQAGFAVFHRTHGENAGFAGTVDPWILLLARADG
jgi:SAM-dependent methyltransferase